MKYAQFQSTDWTCQNTTKKKKVILLEEKQVAKAAMHTRGFFDIFIVRVPAFPTIGPDMLL